MLSEWFMIVKIGRDQPLQIHKLLKWTHSTSENFIVWNISSILDAFVFPLVMNWMDGFSQCLYLRCVLSIQGVGHFCGVGAAGTCQGAECLSENCWGSSQAVCCWLSRGSSSEVVSLYWGVKGFHHTSAGVTEICNHGIARFSSWQVTQICILTLWTVSWETQSRIRARFTEHWQISCRRIPVVGAPRSWTDLGVWHGVRDIRLVWSRWAQHCHLRLLWAAQTGRAVGKAWKKQHLLLSSV